ncbi:YfhH family protein [Fictibacillus iocasae]|uniref:YfhH family protein n=1 Tax=Fictibacillus iocasae TaxID=2715437 RepID=A0ABW2NTC5_9BACL
MEKRFSDMTEHELQMEIAAMRAKAQKAEQMGMVSEFAVYDRKIALAKSYLVDLEQFESGKSYELQGDPGSLFKLVYLNGVFAWGYKNGNTEMEAYPVSMLITT